MHQAVCDTLAAAALLCCLSHRTTNQKHWFMYVKMLTLVGAGERAGDDVDCGWRCCNTRAHDRDSSTPKASFYCAEVTAAGRAQVLDSAALPMLLVDGYNVIWASKRLARLARLRSLDHARERLVNEVPPQCVTRVWV